MPSEEAFFHPDVPVPTSELKRDNSVLRGFGV